MTIRFAVALAAIAVLVAPAAVTAYPGGTPDYQTDVAPYCAACHSSRDAESLAGTGEQAAKEVAERKHVALILSGQKGYEGLSEAELALLTEEHKTYLQVQGHNAPWRKWLQVFARTAMRKTTTKPRAKRRKDRPMAAVPIPKKIARAAIRPRR